MKPGRAALVGAALLAGGGAWLQRAGVGLWQLALAIAAAAAVLALVLFGQRALAWAHERAREHAWRHEEGRHHAFGGVTLQVHDDGRHVWLGGAGLQRVLGRREADDVLAARVPGRWRHDERGRLQLRVDAVIEHLAHMPGRDDPRVQKFRRYLERDVLFPATERHRRR